MADFYDSPLAASDEEQKQERERIKIALAEAELRAQLSGQPSGAVVAFGGLSVLDPDHCPTQARERHQQRLASIQAVCEAVKVLNQEL